jgi:polyprenyl-phospho-N-acetylgalactosaminyl synthase
MSSAFRPCALVPTYDNPRTIGEVVARIREHMSDVVVVDDGSGPPGRAAVEALGRRGLAHVVHRDRNGGKGAAVKAGFRHARSLGYTHALQIDADGQHVIDDIPRFLEAAREQPEALLLGAPVFDASAPASRRVGRKITQFWTNVETLGRVIRDPMCGFRVYPLDAAIAAGARGDAMDFDPEIAVRMVWGGVRVVNLETRVRYVDASEGGISHFRLGRDNVLISWMHTRLVVTAIFRLLTGGARRLGRGGDLAQRRLVT